MISTDPRTRAIVWCVLAAFGTIVFSFILGPVGWLAPVILGLLCIPAGALWLMGKLLRRGR